MRILWIDDDSYRTKTLLESLNLFGYDIDFFSNYEEGLEVIRSDPKKYDAVMLDIMMPPSKLDDAKKSDDGTKTGFILYEYIREFYWGPILVYTVVRNSDSLKKHLGHDPKAAWLNKPVQVEDIIEKIKKLMQ